MEGVEGGQAVERYDTFDAVRNLFGGARKSSKEESLTLQNKGRRRSDPRSFVKPPVSLADDTSEEVSASERISQAKELAVILEAKKVAEEHRVSELKTKNERPLSASTVKKHSQLNDPYSLLMEKASSFTSLYSDKGYGTSSPKPSNGSLSPRASSESNLLDDSLGSETIGDLASKEHPLMAWSTSPDHKQPRRFIRNKQLMASEESLEEETPELRKLRETVETLESKVSDIDMLRPGYSPQVQLHTRVTGEVRVPIPESKYKEFASGDELDDSALEQNLKKFEYGKFIQPDPEPSQTSSVEETPKVPDIPPSADSGSDDCPTPDIVHGSPVPQRAQSSSSLTLHQYMVKLQAKKHRLSCTGVDEVDQNSSKIPREKNPHQVLEDDEVLRKSMQWDDALGEWVFEGKQKPYSPQMASKHEKRRSRQIHIPAPDSAYEPFLNQDEDDSSWQQGLVKATPGKFIVQESPNSSSDVLPGNDSTDGLEEVQDKQPCSSTPDTTKQTTTAEESPQPTIATTITTTPTGNSVSSNEDPEVLSSQTSNKETNEEEEEEIAIAKKIEERAKMFGGVRLRRAKSFSAKHSVTRALARRQGTVDDSAMKTQSAKQPTLRKTEGDTSSTTHTSTNSTSTKSSIKEKFHHSISIKIASFRK